MIKSTCSILLIMKHQRIILAALFTLLRVKVSSCFTVVSTPCKTSNLNGAHFSSDHERINIHFISGRGRKISFVGQICMVSKEGNVFDAELLNQDDDDDQEAQENYEWIPDRDRARIARESQWKRADVDPSTVNSKNNPNNNQRENIRPEASTTSRKSKKSKRVVYTDEEEELISILGGKDISNPSPKREIGFLGDCTLKEISLDYQVPICYLADVLCGWGVAPPIDPNALLGDMVTGEQAFAILEAIHTLDVGSLNDRYADYDLATLCNEYDIELSDGFELAMKEGWNLPFGVRTFLRVEQEDHLIDKLAKDVW